MNAERTLMLVDDSRDILDAVGGWLELRGYRVFSADSAGSARAILTSLAPDLIVLDIMLGDYSGLELCGEIRGKSDVPVLFLTSLGNSSDIVKGLRAGADDYISKPFDFEVLEARICALLRRAAAPAGRDGLALGNLRLDAVSGRAFVAGADIQLTPTEFSLIRLLAGNTGRYVSPGEIYRKVWAAGGSPDLRTVKQHVYSARQKIRAGGADVEIESIRNAGYRLRRVRATPVCDVSSVLA